MHRTTSTPVIVKMLEMLPLLIVLAMLLAACGETSGTQTSGQGQGTAPQGGTPTLATGGSSNSTNSGGASQQATATVPSAKVTAPPQDNSRKDWSGLDVCKLLTKQEIESTAAVGPIADGAPDPEYSAAEDGRASCRFNNTSQVPTVLLAIGPLVMWDSEHNSAVDEGLNPQDFSGVGDNAFIFGDSLIAKWQSKGLTIRLTLYIQDPFQPDQAKQLAQKVYERLP